MRFWVCCQDLAISCAFLVEVDGALSVGKLRFGKRVVAGARACRDEVRWLVAFCGLTVSDVEIKWHAA